MKASTLYTELDNAVKPLEPEPGWHIPLELDRSICGRFIESLIFSEEVLIPLIGPALEIVVLIRWLGEKELQKLLADGGLKFLYCPGTIGYIPPKAKEALHLRAGPGLESFVGIAPSWHNVNEAVFFALTKQTDFNIGKTRRWAQRVSRYATALPSTKIAEEAIKLAYQDAKGELGKKLGMTPEIDLNSLDLKQDDKLITALVNLASAHKDILIAANSNCSDLVGNEITWAVFANRLKGIGLQKRSSKKLTQILKFEGLPDIPKLVKQGLPVQKLTNIRNDRRIAEFRAWLRNLPENQEELEVIKAYYSTFKEQISDRLPVKIASWGITTLLGLLPVIGNLVIGNLASLADTLWGDRLINGWNPKVFIDKHFKYSKTVLGKKSTIPPFTV